jgi:hypothetical protein
MRLFVSTLTLLVALSSPAFADGRVQGLLGNLPLYFVENRGQEDPRVAYYVPGKNITTYFTDGGVTFAFSSPVPPRPRHARFVPEPAKRERWALKLDFVGARPVLPRGQDVLPTIFSYFKGPESEWKTGLRTYAGVVYPELWPGIDLVHGGGGGRLKYAFHVKPGADPSQIKLAYRGATSVVLDRGRLEVATPLGGFTDERPYAYQDLADGRRVEIATRYAKAAGQHGYGFDVGEYDHSRTLVLDPGLFVYSGYIGGSGDDQALAIAIDSAGNAYVAGVTTSTVPSFPGTAGPDLIQNGASDAFVAKVKADGSGLVYAGYIGGADDDSAHGIAVDSTGHAYVTGSTNSADFPVRLGPSLTFNAGISISLSLGDAFVTKLTPDGTDLVYSGFIGGTSDDGGNAIAVDSAGNAYVAGDTASNEANFPVKNGPGLISRVVCDRRCNSDAFVAKVKADGTGLVYAGFIGGNESDSASGIAVDSSGNAYVVGFTRSDQNSFPVTGGPRLVHGGGADGFVAKVNPNGTALVYAGYIGGAGQDSASAIAVDSAGNAYVAGVTDSDQTTFPATVGPGLTSNAGDNAFVAKVKPDGSGFHYAGYVGPGKATGIRVGSAGNAYVAGSTSSDQFPVHLGPDLTYNGGSLDGFVAKVTADGSGLLFAGYVGGTDFDQVSGIALHSSGDIYLAGSTFSNDFPTSVGPSTVFGGSNDAFVVKLSGKPDLLESFITPALFGEVVNTKPGATFTLLDTAVNIGLGTAPASTTRYYLSSDKVKSAGDILLGQRSVPSLTPGSSHTPSAAVTVTVPTSTATGTYHVIVCANDLQPIAEVDTTNNCMASNGTVKVTLPDLRATSVSNPLTPAPPGQSFTVTDTVQNAGVVPAGATTTRYYLHAATNNVKSASDVRLTGTRSVPTLSAGASSTGTATVTIPSSVTLGSYFLLACADDSTAVNETDENNNCVVSSAGVFVTLPNLQVSSVSAPPATANVGGTFSVTDTVRNLGFLEAGTSTTRYYLSADTVRNTGDIRLTGSRSVPSLAARNVCCPFPSSTGSVTVTIPSTTGAGIYHVLACADDLTAVKESDETDNCRASTGTVNITSTGTFELSPTAATVLPDQLVLYRLTWITPGVWTDLASLDLRFVGSADGTVIFWVRWDQASNTFTLVDTDGTATGRPAAPGSSDILQTGNAVLHLDQTTGVPGGPTAPDVTLTLAMSFKSEAAGQAQTDYRVEVNGTDDFGRTQGFAQGGTLRVERSAPVTATLTGSASGVASGTDNGSIRLQGQFTATETIALNEATLTLTSLLEEVGGAGELTRGTGGVAVLPLTLVARAGGKSTDAIYETPSGVRPIVWAEIKTRDAATGLTEFYIKVDRATIPVGPALCSAGSSPATQLRTSFSVQAGGTAAGVDLTLPWRCLGSELKTP